jgi:hypothetical protein
MLACYEPAHRGASEPAHDGGQDAKLGRTRKMLSRLPARFPLYFAMQVTLDLPPISQPPWLRPDRPATRRPRKLPPSNSTREDKLSTGQLRRLLGYRTRMPGPCFLKERWRVFLRYGFADLDHDLFRQVFSRPRICRAHSLSSSLALASSKTACCCALNRRSSSAAASLLCCSSSR